jgi:hypothetical protein
MDLSPAKREVLEALLLHDKPVKAAQLAKEIGRDFPAVQMHLIGLTKTGQAESPTKGHYIISVNGKKTLGLPEVTREKAFSILALTPSDKAFHFYAGIGKPLNVLANSLQQFCNELSKVSAESVLFHLSRSDFEVWFKFLGDLELARKADLLKEKKMNTEDLRVRLRELAEDRCIALSKLTGQSAPH